MTTHRYTPNPSDIPALISGELAEIVERMNPQPEPDGTDESFLKITNSQGGSLSWLKQLTPMQMLTEPYAPYQPGDELVVMEDHPMLIGGQIYRADKPERISEDARFSADTMPDRASRLILTIASTQVVQREGVWVWVYGVKVKGDSDE